MEEDQNIQNPAVSEVTQPIPPTNPVKPVSKFSLKLVIGIIIFLLLAGGAAAGYVYREPILKIVSKSTPTPTVIPNEVKDPSPTPDPTADWKTFISPDNKFSLKYPKDWKSFNNSDSDKRKRWAFNDPCYDFAHPCPTFPPKSNYQISIEEIQDSSNISLTDYIKKQKEGWGKESDLYDVKISIPLFGRETASGSVLSLAGPWWLLTLIKNDNEIISIECLSCEKEFNDQILSTVKFSDTQTDTSNWKTYTNGQFGLTIKYPEELPILEQNIPEGVKDYSIVHFVKPLAEPGMGPFDGVYIVMYGNSVSPADLQQQKVGYDSLSELTVGQSKRTGGMDVIRIKNDSSHPEAFAFEERAVPGYPAEMFDYVKSYTIKGSKGLYHIYFVPKDTSDNRVSLFNEMMNTLKISN